jgi:hypothetical protein
MVRATSAVDAYRQEQPHRINQNRALASFDFLTTIKALLVRLACGFDRLTVNTAPALGCALRPACSRTCTRNRSLSFCQVPSLLQR